MTQADFKEFEAAMNKAALALDVALTPAKIAVYFEDLADLPIGAVTDALAKARRAQVYAGFPKIAEIRKFAEGSSEDQAELAWRTALALCGESSNASLRVYDPAMAYAIQGLGGWVSLVERVRDASVEMLASYERQFKTGYRLAVSQPDRTAAPDYFVGTMEAGNRQNHVTVAAWAARNGRTTVQQEVLAVTATGFLKIQVPFDAATMQLTADARKALQAGGEPLKKYLSAPVALRRSLPPAAPEEMASPEEVAAIKLQIRQLAGGNRIPDAGPESEAIQ